MNFSEFQNKVQKKAGRKMFKVRNSWGIYDCYKLIRKHGWFDIGRPVKEHEFYSVVRGVNLLLAGEISNGRTVVLPSRMGKLELRKSHRGVSIVGGKLKVTYPVDWKNTLLLWFEDKEAMQQKTLCRDEQEYVYHIKYCKYDATYENKIFYEFTLNRQIKKALKENIKQGKIDTLW